MKRVLIPGVLLAMVATLYWLWPEEQASLQTRAGPGVVAEPRQPQPKRPVEARTAEFRSRALRRGETVAGWLRPELLHGRSLEEETEPQVFVDDVYGLKGILVVKDKPWIKVPGMRIRLTTAFLDTVMPPDSAKFDDKLFLEAEGETDKYGKFAIENVLLRKNLFLVVQQHGRVYEVIKLTEMPRVGETKDLGDVPFEERGQVRGLVVDSSDRPVKDVVVRSVDDVYNRGADRDQVLHQARVLRAAQYDTVRRRQGKEQRRASVTATCRSRPRRRTRPDSSCSWECVQVRRRCS